jgi:hypothetical protein
MSLASYIGCNIEIPINDHEYSDDFFILAVVLPVSMTC